MTISTYSIDDAQFQHIVTVTYEAAITGLVAAGELTQEQGQHIIGTYTVLRVRKGFFGQALDRLMGKDATDAAWMAKLIAVDITRPKP